MSRINNSEDFVIPNYLKCPITREIMVNPVVATDGFTYEKSAIENWLSRKKISPVSGQELKSPTLFENKLIKGLIYTFNYSKNQYYFYKNKLINVKRKSDINKKNTLLNIKIKEKDIILSKEILRKCLDNYFKSTLDLKLCCEEMKKAIDLNPIDSEIILNYANILRYSGKFEDALKYNKKLKLINESELISKYMKIRIYSEMGQKFEAIEKLENLLLVNLISEHTLLDIRFLSTTYLSTDFLEISEDYIKAYLREIPHDPRALSHMINLQYINEQFEKVINESKEYLIHNPDDVSVLFYLAESHKELENTEEALRIYQNVNNFSKDKTVKAKSLYKSAVLRDNKKEFALIIKELEESFNLDPKEEADIFLAALYTDNKMYNKAEEWIKKCSERIDIQNDELILGIQAEIFEYNKKYEEAISNYIRLTEISKNDFNFYESKIEELLEKKEEN